MLLLRLFKRERLVRGHARCLDNRLQVSEDDIRDPSPKLIGGNGTTLPQSHLSWVEPWLSTAFLPLEFLMAFGFNRWL